MKIRLFLLIPCLFSCSLVVFGQTSDIIAAVGKQRRENPDVGQSFNTSRIINGHSVYTIPQGSLEFRMGHRFGDIAGENGGAQTLFGFDNAADMRFALEYGITDDLMVGIGRSKGTGTAYKALVDGFVKYRLLRQKKYGMPVSMAVLGTTSFSYMKKVSDLTQVASFPKVSHRLAYSAQLNIAKKFGEKLSLSLMPTVVHRNLVTPDDVNTLFSVGAAVKYSVSSSFSILLEYYHALHQSDIRSAKLNGLGVGFEFVTHGHSFIFNLTNSQGFGETQFITDTEEDWLKGQFRLGFSITRSFIKH